MPATAEIQVVDRPQTDDVLLELVEATGREVPFVEQLRVVADAGGADGLAGLALVVAMVAELVRPVALDAPVGRHLVLALDDGCLVLTGNDTSELP